MTYTLYYSPGTASMCVHWMLIEMGAEFDATCAWDVRIRPQADVFDRINCNL